jgi:hypothetical protein
MGDRIACFGRFRPMLAIFLVVGLAGLGYCGLTVWRLEQLGKISVFGMLAEDARLLWAKHHEEWDKMLADLREDRIQEADVCDKMKALGFLDVKYDRRTGVLIATFSKVASLAGTGYGFLEWMPLESSEERKSIYGTGEPRLAAKVEQLDAHWWLRFL